MAPCPGEANGYAAGGAVGGAVSRTAKMLTGVAWGLSLRPRATRATLS